MFEKDFQFFLEKRGDFAKDHHWEFVVISWGEAKDYFSDQSDAYDFWVETFWLGNFYVGQCIEESEEKEEIVSRAFA